MKRSKFNLSHYKVFTCDMGLLIPISCVDVLPGDTFRHSTNILIRMSPMLAPVMHPIIVRIHHWYVPYRLLWEDWEEFITGGHDGFGVSTPEFPTISIAPKVSSLSDYLGLPLSDSAPYVVSALPFRAYNMIWNNFYRDQDLQDELPISFEAGSDSTTSTSLQRIAWQKDYFTTSRPWTQKGAEVSVPVQPATTSNTSYEQYIFHMEYRGRSNNYVLSPGECGLDESIRNTYTTEVLLNAIAGKSPGDAISLPTLSGSPATAKYGNDVGCSAVNILSAKYVSKQTVVGIIPTATSYTCGDYIPNPQTRITTLDLTLNVARNVGSISIMDLRKALAIQRFEEARANYGSRYIEFLRAAYGVSPRDYRLQLPEYLGGGRQHLRINEVLQTAEGSDPVGTMRGHGFGLVGSNRYKKMFVEHGVLLTLCSILPETMYTQGLNRMWIKRSPLDFYMKEYSNVGMQEVFAQEIYGLAPPGTIFGYQDRYDEYRRCVSSVSGEFRTTLDFWTFARQFASEPVLNGTFVTANPTKRVFATQDTNTLWCLANHSLYARRVLPKRASTKLK